SGIEGSRRAGWTDDAEWHDPPTLPDAGVHRGADAVAARLDELRGLLPHQLEIVDASPVGDDEVLVLLEFRGGGRTSGVPVAQEMGCLMQIRGDSVSRWRAFMSHEEAREAAESRA